MKASELRIGNYLQLRNPENLLPELKGWSVEKCNIHHLNDLTYKNKEWEYKPIPLTEEWLLKFGATIENKKFTHSRFLLIWKEAYKYWYVVDYLSKTYLTKISYVHEWQNFVFVMDGKELQLTNSNNTKPKEG